MRALTRKVGPLPVWAWAAIVLVIAFIVWRRRKSSTAGTTSGASPGGATIVTGNTPATAGPQDAALAGQPSTATPPAAGLDPATLDSLVGPDSPLVSALNALALAPYTAPTPDATASGAGTGGGAVSTPTIGASTGGFTPTTTVAHSTPLAPPAKPAPAKPFGGIVSKVRLKNGATLTTYASGRKIEHAPGRSPYVVHR